MPGFSGVDSEVGRLRAVIVHRPGAELKRVLPRHAGQLLFAGLPWAARAQQEHDIFTQVLRDHGVQVLYLTELLQDVLEYAPARQQAITAALGSALVDDELAGQLRRHLDGLTPRTSPRPSSPGSPRVSSGPAAARCTRGAVYQLLGTSEFLLRPLSDLVFLRDPSVWISDQVAVASPAAASRRVAAELIGIIYARHPLFAGTKTLYRPGQEPLPGGDLLLAAPGVIAAGCSLTARVLTPGPGGPRVSHPQAFLAAAAAASGLDRLRVVETGFGPAGREQWDDAGNLLVLAPGLVVTHERNVATLASWNDAESRASPCRAMSCAARGAGRAACAARSARIRRRFRPAYAPNSKNVLSVVTWLPSARRGMVPLVELNVSSRFHDDHTIVTICGEIDLYTAPRLHSELGAVLVDGMPTRVVIDMSGVDFCDSTGMNVLLSCLRRVRERGGELEIASPKPAVRKILQVTGLDSVFTLVGDSALNRPKPAVQQ